VPRSDRTIFRAESELQCACFRSRRKKIFEAPLTSSGGCVGPATKSLDAPVETPPSVRADILADTKATAPAPHGAETHH